MCDSCDCIPSARNIHRTWNIVNVIEINNLMFNDKFTENSLALDFLLVFSTLHSMQQILRL